MKTSARLALCAVALAYASAAAAAEFKLLAHTFTLPDGFEIELVAGTNLVPRPIEADFDEQGRLYVTDSSGSNDKVEKQLAEKPHRVVRLEDSAGDGKFDKSIVFADKMMFPEGCMWLDGSLYVAAPPSIWKLTDTNNDGVADVRVEWFQGKTLTGCANDLHGPYAGPAGWIYWCKGAFAKQTYTLPNGKEFTTRASHIFRARPDGTGVEPVMTGGMDNPVGLAFTPEGERILSGTFFQHPAGGKRDGLIHALYGGVYGKDHDVLDGHPRTGDLLPMMTHLGAAAPAGLMRYESDVFGKDFQNNLFVACFNMHKIVRCVMEPSGATYKTTDSDFLVSDNTDFHPTDVLEDADGSLLVVDTGGWYKLCCPTSQLEKPDVLGGIYRVRRKGVPKLENPRGTLTEWQSTTVSHLLNSLDDPRPAVQKRAIQELVKRGGDESIYGLVDTLRQHSSVRARRNAVWALAQWGSAASINYLQAGLADADPSVLHSALNASATHQSSYATEYAQKLLENTAPHVRRVTAELLGRSDGSPEWLLSAAANAGSDRALEHAIIHALIEIGDAEATRLGLNSTNPAISRAALIALDQMPKGGLKAQIILPLLESGHAKLKETALWIIGHHPEWGGEVARWIQDRFKFVSSSFENPQFADILARGSGQAEVQQRIVELAGHPAAHATALSAMARSRLTEIPTAWGEGVRVGLQSSWAGHQKLAIAAATTFASAKKNQTELTGPLLAFARDTTHTKELRLAALAALPGSAITSDAGTFEFLRAGLASTNSIAERSAAASVLAKARLNETQLLALAESAKDAGPIELPKLLGAFTRATNENVGLALIASLEKSKSLASLRAETVKPHLTNFPTVVQQRAEALLASLNTDAAQQKKHIDDMLASVKGGDIRRGQALFNSAKTACSACHAIGYLGGTVGPDLTRIGQIRTERDLLEAIVYPSTSFVRSYEPVLVQTRDGEAHNGVLRRDAPDEVVLATGPNMETRIARADIAQMLPGTVSVMPQGLAEQLSRQELADLLAFLRATRW